MTIESKLFAGLNRTPNAIMVTLPWPDWLLSPNARCHWSRKARAAKAARTAAFYLTREQTGGSAVNWPSPHLLWEFCPPDKRRRDADNIIASLKSASDGISDALGVDDSAFVSTYHMAEPVKHGAIRVTVCDGQSDFIEVLKHKQG